MLGKYSHSINFNDLNKPKGSVYALDENSQNTSVHMNVNNYSNKFKRLGFYMYM